jgi:acetylglutamate kinase
MSGIGAAAIKARTLVEAVPYLRSYRGRVVVVKLGGEPLDDPGLCARVAEDLALLALVGIRVVVVHGGGPQISRETKRLGIEPQFVAGLRVTDDASMDVVQRTLVGEINSNLVRALNDAGADAVGISGIDAWARWSSFGLPSSRRCWNEASPPWSRPSACPATA